ncbi:MAG: glycosyltransferase family 4 protein [Clostridia bacterium]|nr:glycosyltransferase family 4 protein [Clostridia bacterium]
MRILMVNKFLYPNGGSETYMFQLGEYLEQHGHSVQYFGMEHPDRCVGNKVNAYTSTMDFHTSKGLAKIGYALKTIYSTESRKKLRLVLDDFRPEVVHLNNFNYQLTPSVIVEIMQWKKASGQNCRIVYTAHDFQLICPNHQLFNPIEKHICEKCIGGGKGRFVNCAKGKCIHSSTVRSVIGFCEAYYWNARGIYRCLDAVICPSQFMKAKLDTSPILAAKTVFLRNFTGTNRSADADISSLPHLPDRYALYFGRFSAEKGIGTLMKAVEALPVIPFVFAGSGPLQEQVDQIKNVVNVGFLSGSLLNGVIRNAAFSIVPSEVFDNCPYAAIESLTLGTPVLGAKIGGIPELIDDGKTGELFQSGDAENLKAKIQSLWEDESRLNQYRENSKSIVFDSVADYAQKLMQIYQP